MIATKEIPGKWRGYFNGIYRFLTGGSFKVCVYVCVWSWLKGVLYGKPHKKCVKWRVCCCPYMSLFPVMSYMHTFEMQSRQGNNSMFTPDTLDVVLVFVNSCVVGLPF